MFASGGVLHQGEERFKRAVVDAEITSGAVVLYDSDHGLAHDLKARPLAIMMCLSNKVTG
jgi:hypothetical protein